MIVRLDPEDIINQSFNIYYSFQIVFVPVTAMIFTVEFFIMSLNVSKFAYKSFTFPLRWMLLSFHHGWSLFVLSHLSLLFRYTAYFVCSHNTKNTRLAEAVPLQWQPSAVYVSDIVFILISFLKDFIANKLLYYYHTHTVSLFIFPA